MKNMGGHGNLSYIGQTYRSASYIGQTRRSASRIGQTRWSAPTAKLNKLSCVFALLVFLTLFINEVHGAKKAKLHGSDIAFIENKGQWAAPVKFRANLNGASFFVEQNGYTVSLVNGKQQQAFFDNKKNPLLKASGIIDAHAFNVQFVNANPHAQVIGAEKKKYYYNYFLGKDSKNWASHVAIYETVCTKNIYPNIDLFFFQDGNHLKYEYVVAPKASPEVIIWEYTGHERLSLQKDKLIISTSVGQMVEMSPVAYQIINDTDTQFVDCHFHIKKNRVSFKLDDYDRNLPLVIDPTLIFSTYSGSNADNWGFTATYDSDGNVFAGGIAFDEGYPVTPGAYQIDYAGGQIDVSISKFDSEGDDLLYSTYIGGSLAEIPHSLIANHNDELYIFGTTSSNNFPTTEECYQNIYYGGMNVHLSNSIHYTTGSDMFIAKLSSDGSQLLSSTYFGGTGNDGVNTSSATRKNYADEVRGEIVLDAHSNVYVSSSTFSSDLPTTENAFQETLGGGQDACVFVMNYNLTNLIWSSYLGSTGNDASYSMVVNNDGSLFLTGGTTSEDFPTTPTAIQPQYGGSVDGFVAKISNDGNTILASSYLGKETYDQGYLIKSDRYSNAYIYGQSSAPANSWVEQADWAHGDGQFLCKLSPYLDSVIWSTEFGTDREEPDISPTALLVDLCNKIYMSGWGAASVNGFGGTAGLPITADAQQTTTDNEDYYLICISDDASYLYYATYFGGDEVGEHVDGGTSRFDRKGRIYQAVCAGCGGSDEFPTTPNAWSENNGSSNCNIGVFKMDFNLPAVVADFDMPLTTCIPEDFEIENHSQTISDSTTFFWNFGDGTTSTEQHPTHTYTEPGIYPVLLVVSDQGSCNFSDSLTQHILVLANTTQTLPTQLLCEGSYVQIGIPPSSGGEVTYQWAPTTGLNNPEISNPTATPDTTTLYTLIISNGVCTDTILQTVTCVDLEIVLEQNHLVCAGDTVTLEPTVNSNIENVMYFWSKTPHFNHIINTNTSVPQFSYCPTMPLTNLYFKAIAGNCELVVPITLTLIDLELETSTEEVACFSDTTTITVTTNYPNCTFEWSPEEFIFSGGNSSSPCVAPPATMDFYVEVTTPEGCIVKDTIEVVKQTGTFPTDVDAWATDQHIYKYESTTLFATEFTDGTYTYEWDPHAGLAHHNQPSTEAEPDVTTIYTVTVTDHFGCQKSDTVTIFVSERICDEPYIFVPNAFTPNFDGANDVLFVRSEILESEIIFKIFDKWGELVFETTNIDQGWDGTFKGKECMPGVYSYFLEGTCFGEVKYFKKGNVTLIR